MKDHPWRMPDWTLEAPCSRQPDLFLPSNNEAPNSLRERRAKRTCARCPFRRECLELGYTEVPWPTVEEDNDGLRFLGSKDRRPAEEYAIWGGSTWAERKAVEHLPLEERVRVLDLWLKGQVHGPFAIARPEEYVELAS